MPRNRRGAQLSVELPPELILEIKAEAARQGRPVAVLVRRWLEQGLVAGVAAPEPASPDLLPRVEALEAAVEALRRQHRSPSPAPSAPRTPPPSGGDQLPQAGDRPARPSGAITTAELALRSDTNRAGWNNWAGKAQLGDVRHHPEAGSWRLVGKAPADAGGPARWLWEPA